LDHAPIFKMCIKILKKIKKLGAYAVFKMSKKF
jgi:hypothetical protein